MGIARTFTANSIYQISSSFASKLIGLFLTVYLAAAFTSYDFGIYSWVISLVMICFIFTDAGTTTALVKYLSGAIGLERRRLAAAYFKFLFKIRLAAVLAVSAALYFFSHQLSASLFGKPYLAVPMQAAALILAAYSISLYLYTVVFTYKRMKYVFLIDISRDIIRLLLTVAMLLFFTKSFYGALLAFGFAFCISLMLYAFVIARRFPWLFGNADTIEKRRICRYMAYTIIAVFAFVMLSNINVLMISALLPIENAGFYNIALAWTGALEGLIPLSLLFPVFAALAVKPRGHLRDAFNLFFKYTAFFVVPLSFGLAFVSRQLIGFLYKQAYELLVPQLLFVLAFVVLFYALSHFIIQLYNSIERPDVPTKIFGIGIIINILVAYFLLSYLKSPLGAAYASVIAYAIMLIALLAALRPVAKLSLRPGDLIKPFAASGIAFYLLLLLPAPANLIIAIPYLLAGSAAYFIIQLAIRGTTVKELLYLKGRILNR